MRVSPLKVATPLLALIVCGPLSVPPSPTSSTATCAVELVTVFPCASWTRTTGGVVIAVAEGPGTGWVVTASCVGVPGVTVTPFAVAAVRLPELNRNT